MLIELGGVSAAYGQSRVLWDANLSIAAGEVMALIGRNGVGKTTLLRAIVGIVPLKEGRIRFTGEEIGAMPPHRRARAGIGYVPQGRHIFPHLTVAENLEAGLSALRAGERHGASVPDLVYQIFPKLAALRARKGGFLSGGEQQQLAIARAIVGKPRLLLLDEPTEGVQPNVVQTIEAALRTIRDELGLTVLIVEQYLDFVWGLADRYAALDGGRVVRTGSTTDERAEEVAHLIRI
ncbi:MAG TPA: urea ABC transporter ATP-binding subunit UrtE [Sphingomonas sp.]